MHQSLEEQVKILTGAGRLFTRIGIKSVSMDDIARELTVSKKTIYKHFKHKKDLVNQIFELTISEEKRSCIQCYEGDDNAIRKR